MHTPGPWKAAAIDDAGWVDIYPVGEFPLPIGSTRHQNVEANARLIAAAPDMLAVLKELAESAAYWSEYDVPLGIVDRINTVIAKAEGR